jgi:N-carbamoyl-L-amino-acid hydrolase
VAGVTEKSGQLVHPQWQAGRVSFEGVWADLGPIGRAPSGGYRRFAWTRADLELREWFTAMADARGLSVSTDRAGNQWAWWGDPDAAASAGRPGVATGSHLDSVPDGGAFDGPLGVVSGFLAIDALRARGVVPVRPVGVVNFVDEEGARFGVACTGSRLLTGALPAERALARTDADGTTLADALTAADREPADLGPDPEALRRIGGFVELHVEQGRGLVDLDQPIAVAGAIWPHGRWRVDLPGVANHAGTTALGDRHDPMLGYARLVLAARASAERHAAVATCGKVHVQPNGVNAIPSQVTAWLDARGPNGADVRAVVDELTELAAAEGGHLVEESWTDETAFDVGTRNRLRETVGDVPVLSTGAGHDAGILCAAGIPTAMIFVRNPTGVSHAPAEHAERADCLAGIAALADVLVALANERASIAGASAPRSGASDR